MSALFRRAAATAAATIVGVGLLIGAKSGSGGSEPVALRQPGVIGRPPEPPAPRSPAATAPPLPGTTVSTEPAPSSSTAAAPSTTGIRPATASSVPATRPPTSSTTTRPPTSSSTAATRPAARPVPTTAAGGSGPPSDGASVTTAPPGTTSTQRPTTSTEPDPATTTTTTAASTTTTAPGTTSYDSPVFTASHGHETYGPVQIRLTFDGHRIVDVVALQTPNHAAKSRQINARAVPILRQEILDAQSARFDTVSGATATSEAYAQCVQAILDQAWK